MRRPPRHPSLLASDRSRARPLWALTAAAALLVPMLAPRSTHGAPKKKASASASTTSATSSPTSSPISSTAASAAKLKADGDAAFDAFHYADALRAYEQAYDLAPDPALLYNRGRALHALGRNPEALAMFERFELEAPKDLQAKVPGLSKLIADIRAHVAVLRVKCNVPGAQIVVGDRVLGETGSLGEARVDAGSIVLKVQKDGYFPVKRELQLSAGKVNDVDVELLSRATSGVLAVVVDPPAARVSIDGAFQGNAPIEVILPAGSHDLTIASEGYEPLSSKAVVKPDGRADVHLTMQSTPGLASRWWFWAGVGTVVVAGVVVTIALTTDRSAPNGTFSPPRVSAPLIRF